MSVFLSLLLTAVSACCEVNEPMPAKPADLAAFVETELKLTSFQTAEVDLNHDGTMEVVIYAMDQTRCGSAGCSLFVLEQNGKKYRLVSRTKITNLPIQVLGSSHNGWRDLAVTVRGGGITQPYVALLPFDGERYAENPTVPPAFRSQNFEATVLISAVREKLGGRKVFAIGEVCKY